MPVPEPQPRELVAELWLERAYGTQEKNFWKPQNVLFYQIVNRTEPLLLEIWTLVPRNLVTPQNLDGRNGFRPDRAKKMTLETWEGFVGGQEEILYRNLCSNQTKS